MLEHKEKLGFSKRGVELIQADKIPNVMARKRTGNSTAVYRNQYELLWSDGSITFGCGICWEQVSYKNTLGRHISTHNTKRAKPATPETPRAKVTKRSSRGRKYLTKSSAILKLDEIIKELEDERDEWKARATAAEGSLKLLREALGVNLAD